MLNGFAGMVMLSEPFSPEFSKVPWRLCAHDFHHAFTHISLDDGDAFRLPVARMLSLRYDALAHFSRCRRVHDAWNVMKETVRFNMFRFLGRTPIMKDPNALLSAEWLAREFGMNVIVLIRHPAAIVSSFKRLNWVFDSRWFLEQPALMQTLLSPLEAEIHDHVRRDRGDLVDNAAFVWKVLSFVVQGYQQRHPDWIFARHEDLSQNPLERFNEIGRKLGLRFTERTRRIVQRSNDASLPAEVSIDEAQTSIRRNSLANIHNWKTRLTPDEICRTRRITEDVSRHFYGDAEW